MQFTTPVPIPKSDFAISHASEVFSLGSCFAENMARKLSYFGFSNLVNPFGILFHPAALENFVDFSVRQKTFPESDIFFHGERWHCFDAHSALSDQDKAKLLENLNAAVRISHERMHSASHFIITLGTAWAYRHSGKLVANCHKVPQREFSKELLSAEAVSQSIVRITNLISEANPNARIIFTVSPVRHLKDGFVENQRSKSNLISGLHHALENLAGAHYFPSYEIVMDELRDYRFYAQDMIHPNSTAIDFIWEKFASAWISQNAAADMAEVDALRKAIAHRPFNPDSESHKKFVSSVQRRAEILRERLPFLHFP